MKTALALILMTSAALAQDAPDEARTACTSDQKMMMALKGEYKESPAWIGASGSGQPVIITQSAEGTWTIVVGRMMQGKHVLCMVASGSDAQTVEVKPDQGDGT